MHESLTSILTAPNSARTPGQSVLVCFSHLRWRFVYQRPQHLLSRAAADHCVYFVEEPVFGRTGVLPRLDIQREACGVVVVVPVLAEGCVGREVVEAQRGLLNGLLAAHGNDETIFWYYTPMALEFSDHFEPDICVYDCMDELSAFRGAPPRLRALERRLFDRCHIVFTGGQSLFEVKRDKHSHVHAFPSSIDSSHFARARRSVADEPVEQAGLPRPRIGFFGVIDERIDLDLIDAVATMRPAWSFVFVGPVVKIDPGTLPKRANIHWLGQKDYKDLPNYLAGWNVAFMPFALNESTRFISPTKTPEFLAAGLPVVSTPITDVVRPYGKLGLVEIARDAGAVAAKLDELLVRPKESWLQTVDRYLRDMSWDKTWAGMCTLMRERDRAGAILPAADRSLVSETH